jgi:hypothetical protein
MNTRVVGLLCGIVCVLLLVWTSNQDKADPVPPKSDLVAKTFSNYESLWRKYAIKTADNIKSGQLDTEKKVWDFLAAGQEPIRRAAFDELAKSEQDYFASKGGWSTKNHEALLRSYGK